MATFDENHSKAEYIAALQRVILELHGCSSRHLETVWVNETILGKSIWDGHVEVFAVNHARAAKCFGWMETRPQGRDRLVAVLGTSAIKTALDAVKFIHIVIAAPLVDEFSKPWPKQDDSPA